MIRGYKAFDKNFSCRGMQFEVGKEYTVEGEIKVCERGIHYCENPLNVLDYYPLIGSRFAIIEDYGDTKKDKNKNATNKIKIVQELQLFELIQEGIKLASSGDYSQLASSGDYSKLASSGNDSKLASIGNNSQLASSGDYSQLENSGKNSVMANIGKFGKVKGKIGDWITLAEFQNDICVCVKSAEITGKKLKADTWYKLENKKFVECDV